MRERLRFLRFLFLHGKNIIWPLEGEGLSGIFKRSHKMCPCSLFMGEKHSEQADEFYFILTVGSDSLFSSLCERITSFTKALFFAFFELLWRPYLEEELIMR